tara:strand:+ start:67 stop:1095 length:1029 start_codon:yes stop_codon:yes gene_type:complete
LTFTVSLRNRESYIESIDVLNPKYCSAIKTTLNRFDKYCKSKYNESEDEILSQLMKQSQDERIVNACDVLQLFISNLSKSISPQTIPSYLSHVLGYFNYRGVKLTSLDKKSIRLPKIIREEKYPLSKDDIRLILDNCSYKRKTLYLVLASSGMRIGETVQLRKKDFDTSGNRIMINIPAKFTKGKKSRRTLVSLEAKPYLMKRLNAIEDDDLVFGTGSTSEVTESKLLNYATKKALPKMERYDSGTRKITLHSFRAFFITQAVRTVGESFAHTLAGQEGYLKVYKRYDKEAMFEDYLKLEPSLFIINDYGLSEQSKDKEIDLLKSEMNDLKILVTGLIEKIK